MQYNVNANVPFSIAVASYGARAPLDIKEFIFSVHFELYNVWSLPAQHCILGWRSCRPGDTLAPIQSAICSTRQYNPVWLSKDDAMVYGRWRKMIRMVDEQEGCERMDVSSGSGSPSLTRTKGRKTVVCVCVVVNVG